MLVVLTACGALGGGTSTSSASTSTNSKVEKSTIRVGVLPVVDAAPLYLAIDKGYFAQEGLTVQPVVVASGPAAVSGMIGGQFDIAYSTYPGILAAQAKGVANSRSSPMAARRRPGASR
jgi:NitT/TauT family transport system substrate-binding protein